MAIIQKKHTLLGIQTFLFHNKEKQLRELYTIKSRVSMNRYNNCLLPIKVDCDNDNDTTTDSNGNQKSPAIAATWIVIPTPVHT